MIPENLTPTTIKMIPRVLPNQKERFETEEIFKRNAQTSEASKHFLTYSEIKVYFYFCCKHLNFFCGEKQLLCHMYMRNKSLWISTIQFSYTVIAPLQAVLIIQKTIFQPQYYHIKTIKSIFQLDFSGGWLVVVRVDRLLLSRIFPF